VLRSPTAVTGTSPPAPKSRWQLDLGTRATARNAVRVQAINALVAARSNGFEASRIARIGRCVSTVLLRDYGSYCLMGRSIVDLRRTGRIFGWLFIGTFVTSIPARLLFIDGAGASWSNLRFVAADASSTSLKWGALLEFGLIVTQLGTALVLYPIARMQSETIALSYVSARTMESVFAAIGLVSMLSLVSVISAMNGASGSEAVALQTQGDSLAHTYEWAFEWGPGLVTGIGNGLLLGYLMYTSALVPPRLALLGLIGGTILILSFLLILAGVYKNGEGPSGLLTLPEAAWELSLGVYCAWKGFRSSSPLAEQARKRELLLAG